MKIIKAALLCLSAAQPNLRAAASARGKQDEACVICFNINH